MKCKNCKIRIEKEDIQILDNIWWKYCTKACRLDFWRKQVKKAKEKQKIKQAKVKAKKQNSISYLTKQADKFWSEAVKIEYNYECQYCWKTTYLNSHHLFTRARKSTRWDIDNWICLCSWCHTLSSNFSAHQTPLEFFEWLEWIRWRDRIDWMSTKSREICNIRFTPKEVYNCNR